MNRDLISEVCSEVIMLAQYASWFEASEAAKPQDDEAVLISGLSLLSAHAERLLRPGALQNRGASQKIERKIVSQQKASETARNPCAGHKHAWINEILKDIIDYTQKNNLDCLSRDLESVLRSVPKQSDTCAPDKSAAVQKIGLGSVLNFPLGYKS